MDRYSDAVLSAAMVMKWRAERLARVHTYSSGWVEWFSVPPRWTAWLLMEKARIPRDLIAHSFDIDEQRLTRALRIATAMMIFPPYAARVEGLREQMGLFGTGGTLTIAPAWEARCFN